MSRRLSNCFNYVGSKYRFIDTINSYLPQDKGLVFLDLFGGGGDVTINSIYDNVTYNEKNKYVCNFMRILRDKSFSYINGILYDIINKYNLDSKNQIGYELLKSDFNSMGGAEKEYYYMFYMLVCHSNSNMIRFNGQNEFNLPFGKRTFNRELRAKMRYANEKLGKIAPRIIQKDFRDVVFEQYNIIYADPPYTKSDATYNECGGWDDGDDLALFDKLSNYSHCGKFLLSNQRISKGVVHSNLLDFVKDEGLCMIDINSNYDACNYQRKNEGATVEVLIKNY